jgi:hypothetical protein
VGESDLLIGTIPVHYASVFLYISYSPLPLIHPHPFCCFQENFHCLFSKRVFDTMTNTFDVEEVLSKLNPVEKVSLLSGQ